MNNQSGNQLVLGVDYSGAKSDKNTWVTQGTLNESVLTLISCERTPRAELATLLASLPSTAVAALDFPFSVPKSFASQWLSKASTMPELWDAAAAIELSDFMTLRDEFVAQNGEPYRRGDFYFPECYSCLHKANPNMVPMTFRGMQMLHGLWQQGCQVPPLPDNHKNGPVLLESMPGAALRAFGLPFKGYKKGRSAAELRSEILGGLATKSGIEIANLADFRDACMENDDSLDSVVAAVSACLWANDSTQFRVPKSGPGEATKRGGTPSPNENELETARLEGWLYAPVFLTTSA